MTEALWGVVGAVVGVVASAVTGWLRDRSNAHRQAHLEREKADRAREVATLQERRAAYTAFQRELASAIDTTYEFERDNGDLPGDVGHEGPIRAVLDALAAVQLSAPYAVRAAAERYSTAFHEWTFSYGTSTVIDVRAAQNDFLIAAQADLGIPQDTSSA